MNIAKESGRVSAFKLTRFDRNKNEEEVVYIPQFEYIKYDEATGNLISSEFICFENKSNKSGLSEFKTELEALKYALKFRDNLDF